MKVMNYSAEEIVVNLHVFDTWNERHDMRNILEECEERLDVLEAALWSDSGGC